MIARWILLTSIISLLAMSPCSAFSAPVAAACPSLSASGKRLPLDPPATEITLDQNLVVPQTLIEAAVVHISKNEGGGADPWTNVSGQERLSVGILQWNWHAGTLVDIFMATIQPDSIEVAPSAIREGLRVLKTYAGSKTAATKARAAAVIEDWSTSQPGDPLVKNRIRKSVTEAWKVWLGTEPVREVQKKLTDSEIARAYAHAVAWQRDRNGSPTTAVDSWLLTYFFDLMTFNGSHKGVWQPQVQAYRNQFPDNASVVKDAANWLDKCAAYRHLDGRKMYATQDAMDTAKMWRKAVAEDPSRFDDQQIDLLVHGLLVARQSVGHDAKYGFPGIYQSDVLTRRGTIALGMGVVHGSVTYPKRIGAH